MYAIPLKRKSAVAVTDAIRDGIRVEDAPQILQTDNEKEFVNSLMSALCNEEKIKHARRRPGHPQNQGQCERANQTLANKLGKELAFDKGKN